MRISFLMRGTEMRWLYVQNLEALQPLLPKIISLLKTATCDHKDMATASK
jgi:hypothetical protein